MSMLVPSAKVRKVRPPGAPNGPRLTVVLQRAAPAPRVPFVAFVVTLLAVGLVGLLVLNTSLQRSAYVVTDLRTRAAQLNLREQNLQTQVARLQSPERLASIAAAAGMVRNDSPAFLSLTTGRVLGVAKPGRTANSVAVYAGRATGSTDKAPFLPAGSHNSIGTGLQRHDSPRAPSPPAAKAEHGAQGATGSPSGTGNQHSTAGSADNGGKASPATPSANRSPR